MRPIVRKKTKIGTRASLRIAACLLVATGSATALSEGSLRAGIAAAQQSIDDLRARSPGARTGADMVKGKPAIAADREARALPRVRDARGSSWAPTAAVAPPILTAPAGVGGAALPEDTGPAAIFAGSTGPGGGGVFIGDGPGGGIIIGPIGGGGIGGGGGGGGGPIVIVEPAPGGPTGVTPAAPTAVPEAATWLTMLAGFFGMGLALRRRAPAEARRA